VRVLLVGALARHAGHVTLDDVDVGAAGCIHPDGRRLRLVLLVGGGLGILLRLGHPPTLGPPGPEREPLTAAGACHSLLDMDAVTRPILPSADLDATTAFYAPLGFDVRGHWPQEYLILAGPDAIELHFWQNPRVDRWTNDVACWVGYRSPADVQRRHDAWAAVGVAEPASLRDVDGAGPLVEFQLIDLHGNLLRVGAPADG
jgi:hypothetical protein